MWTPTIRVQSDDFNPDTETALLTHRRTDIGAIINFTGFCRDEAGALSCLEIEHYPGMAETEIHRVAEEARSRWPLQGITIIHRYGRISPGARIVLVLVASRHRKAAFESAQFIMDFLKTQAPFWKKAHHVGKTQSEWVDAKLEDDNAAARWRVEE